MSYGESFDFTYLIMVLWSFGPAQITYILLLCIFIALSIESGWKHRKAMKKENNELYLRHKEHIERVRTYLLCLLCTTISLVPFIGGIIAAIVIKQTKLV